MTDGFSRGGHLLLRLAVGGDDELVVAGVVARGAGVLLHVVLAHLVHALDGLAGLLFGHVLLAHDALHATLHRGLDEDAQVVGMQAEHVEAAAAGHHARLLSSVVSRSGASPFFGM